MERVCIIGENYITCAGSEIILSVLLFIMTYAMFVFMMMYLIEKRKVAYLLRRGRKKISPYTVDLPGPSVDFFGMLRRG